MFPGTFAPWNDSSRELYLPGAKVPGNFRSRERMFPVGTFAPRSKNTGEQKDPEPLHQITTAVHSVMLNLANFSKVAK